MVVWIGQKVVNQLDCFGILNGNVLALNYALKEVLVYVLAKRAPLVAVVHDEQMIPYKQSVRLGVDADNDGQDLW